MRISKIFSYLKNEARTLRNLVYHRFNPRFRINTIDEFHKIYMAEMEKMYWLGIETVKCPLDLWVYQEIIFEVKPDLIIECGTASGGSALFLATICDVVNNGRIVTIDIAESQDRPKHKRVTYLRGSSVSQEIKDRVQKSIKADDKKIMVILDSDHHKDHVLKELRFYSTLLTKGSYLVVEDTQVGGHPIYPNFGPGPMEAVRDFLKENRDFVVDKTKEKFLITFNPNGYLKKIV